MTSAADYEWTNPGGPTSMARLGFEVEESEDDDYEIGPVHEASYALMEHLTGIRLTPAHLAGPFQTGLIDLPH